MVGWSEFNSRLPLPIQLQKIVVTKELSDETKEELRRHLKPIAFSYEPGNLASREEARRKANANSQLRQRIVKLLKENP